MALHDPVWDDILSVAIPILALVPFLIALRAYKRTRTPRVLLFTAAFGVLFLKGMVIAVEVLVWPGNATLDALELAAEAFVPILFMLGMLKG